MIAAVSRERIAVAAALVVSSVAGLWFTRVLGDRLMMAEGVDFPYALLLFLMWWSMMMAMMLPSAAPAILTYGTIARRMPPARPLAFALGYVAVWTLFSAIVTALQISVMPLTGMMAIASKVIGGMLLILAGLYQLTRFKRACLTRCQTPLFYLAHHWHSGGLGAFRMGLSHGRYCLGCCWLLMMLLFYGGVMDMRWIIGLALYVAIEKLTPQRFGLDRVAAAALIIWGSTVIALASYFR